jgi:hypothetical protein
VPKNPDAVIEPVTTNPCGKLNVPDMYDAVVANELLIDADAQDTDTGVDALVAYEALNA